MNITKDVITDLFPLYAEGECSADTRALVEDYLQRHPQHAEDLRRTLDTGLPGPRLAAPGLDELRSLKEARRRVRLSAWLLGFAIFFSLTPLSFEYNHGEMHWLVLGSPRLTLAYLAVAAVLWIAYATVRRRSNAL